MLIKCAHDEVLPLHKLVPNPENPNKHPDKQIEMLAKIIDYQGQRSPIVVSTLSGFIVKGHGRLEAIRRLGWESAAVDYQDYDNAAQEFADLIADNKIAELAEHDDMVMIEGINLHGIKDFELLGLADFVLPEVEKLEPQCDEDEVPEKVETRSRPGDIWQLGRHRLMCGDSTNIQHVEALMGGEKAELCFTSPPYADQRDYNGGKELSVEHLKTFIRTACEFVSYFAINLGYARKNGEVYSYWDDYVLEAKDSGLKFLSWNIWDKGECGSIGNQTAMFAIQHEWIFVFGPETKELNLTVANKNLGKNRHGSIRQKDGSLSAVKNTKEKVREFSQLKTILFQSPQKARNHDIKHPAMFPVEFPEHYIEAMTSQKDGVYEPFGGSGSTLIACEKTNRKCFMMELDPHYCDVILARWEKYTGKEAVRLNDQTTN